MSYNPHNPSYYRSHLYAHQFNLPDSAFINRKTPVYTSEMPQGVNPFAPSQKKHFQNAGYHSIITQQKLINHQTPEEANSPAKNKDYERNLSIEDIEGASTNTLISKAIKNRIKAKEYCLRKEKQVERENTARRTREQAVSEHQNANQKEAQRIIQRYKNEANYHERIRAVKTEQSVENPQYISQPSNEAINRYRNDLKETEKQIEQLQYKLRLARQQAAQGKKPDLKMVNKADENHVKYVPQPKAAKNVLSKELKLPKIGENQHASLKKTEPYNQPLQIGQKIDRKRSYTQPAEPLYEDQRRPEPYYRKDRVIQDQGGNDKQGNVMERLMQSRARRQQIRKLNPTYLSYGSFAGGNNARMVYL